MPVVSNSMQLSNGLPPPPPMHEAHTYPHVQPTIMHQQQQYQQQQQPFAAQQQNPYAVGPEQVTLPDKYIGSIIGKGGSMIQKIRSETQAELKISPANEMGPNGERVITITGTADQRSKAKLMMQNRVAKSMQAENRQLQPPYNHN